MNLSLVLLKTGHILISQSDELDYEPKVHLVQPHTISGKTKVTLTRWPEFTDDEHILLRSEDLLTVCEPTEEIRKAYLKKIGKTEKELTSTPKPVILNEEEIQPDPSSDEYDDYEPSYQEI